MSSSTSRRQASPSRSFVGAVLTRIVRTIRSPGTLLSTLVNRRFFFAFLTAALITAKFCHLSTHIQALTPEQIFPWSYSFFLQDVAWLLFIRCLMGDWLFSQEKQRRGCFKFLGQAFTAFLVFYSCSLSIISTTFFAATGAQAHWRNAAFAGADAASRALMLSGMVYFVFIMAGLTVTGWVLRNVAFNLSGLAIQLIFTPFTRAVCRRQPQGWVDESYNDKYTAVAQDDDEEAAYRRGAGSLGPVSSARTTGYSKFTKIVVILALGFQVFCYVFRPKSSAMTYMSWTTPLHPIIEFSSTEPTLEGISGFSTQQLNRMEKSPSALGEPITLSWLPKDGKTRAGFEDWYESGRDHYRASKDPLKIDNLDSPLLPELKKMLSDVDIRHVMIIELESTRKDLFPLKKDNLVWNRLQESFGNKSLPADAFERLRTLTPTANYITGDYDDGFQRPKVNETRRGGISFNDAYTATTYTIKSLMTSLCGLNPLMADFNQEWEHHIYQPCMPHILDTFNELEKEKVGDYRTYGWKSYYMQTATMSFDKMEKLMPKLGFPDERTVHKEYLQSDKAKFGKVTLPDVNYFGFVEQPLADYMHDAFQSAKKNNERAFIMHLTSTSHHPYGIPEEEPYVPVADGLDDMSKYINAIGYDDRWLSEVLEILDNEGVANETLIVFAGDHGISIPENDVLASYFNPNVGCNHIPLVFSHPSLPPITIENAVTNVQILPTILDLLLETDSLSPKSANAAKDLVRNYEGQSMIRSMKYDTQDNSVKTEDPSPYPDWQFTNVNPGYSMVGVRDTTHKDWRMVVPVIDNQEWQFSNIADDPREQNTVKEFDFSGFIAKVNSMRGAEAARWAEEAAFAARYFVEENRKRWRYGEYSDKSKEEKEQKEKEANATKAA